MPAETRPPHVLLETSAAVAYLEKEPEFQDLQRLIQLAECEEIEINLSDFARSEIDATKHATDRLQRLYSVVRPIPRVARIGTWVLGRDMLAHDESTRIEKVFPKGASTPDREQFLSFAARHHHSFFVTKDKDDFLKPRLASEWQTLGFLVGLPSDCIAWLAGLGIT